MKYVLEPPDGPVVVRRFLKPVSRDSSSDAGFSQGNDHVVQAHQGRSLSIPSESNSLTSSSSVPREGPLIYQPPSGYEAYQCDLCECRIRRTAAFESHMRNVHALVFGQKSRTTCAINCVDTRNATWTAKLRCRNGTDTFIEGGSVPRTPAGPASRKGFSLEELERRDTYAISSMSDEIGTAPGKRNRTITGTNLCSPTADIISLAHKKRDKATISPTKSTFGDGKRYKRDRPTLASPQSARLPATLPWMSDGLRAQLDRRRSQEARAKAWGSSCSGVG